MRLLLFSIICVLTLVCNNHAQAQEAKDPPSFGTPMPLLGVDVIGERTYPISSRNAKAKAYFNQGMQLMFAFAKEDAARSFREAQKNDPDCAMCYWGEAWSWGSYLNGAMTNAEAPRAYKALGEAQQRADLFATTRERDLIIALSKRYVKNYNRDKRAVQDTAYANAMSVLYKKYPEDMDIATLYADALFLLEPRRGYRDSNDPDVRFLHSVLEGILEKDIKHPGACHLYIHATESTDRPEKALECAEHLGTAIPGASHINHMPSHTWNRTGDWGKAVRANLMAWHSDMKASVNKGVAIYPTHNLHMLLFAASIDGQGAIAMQAARDYTKLGGNNMYESLTYVRFGRFEEIESITDRPANQIQAGMYDFGKGYAAAKLGDLESAKDYLESLTKLAQTSTARFRFHDAKNLLGTVQWILSGEIAWIEGDMDKAVTDFNRAVDYYDAMDYDEPEPLPFSPRDWLGAAYVEMGQFNNALNTYRKSLLDHPNNGWALYGMKQAYDNVNRPNEEIDAQFEEAWARSDTWIRASKF